VSNWLLVVNSCTVFKPRLRAWPRLTSSYTARIWMRLHVQVGYLLFSNC
jgi:hypothetical protein